MSTNIDFIKQLGDLALASRLKRLSEKMLQDVSLAYKEQSIDFEPRWFTLFALLKERSPLSIVDIAKTLGVTHPAINQIASEMMKKGLVKASSDKKDKRKRLLTLTPLGESLTPTLFPIWQDIEQAAQKLIFETGVDLMGVIDKLEYGMEQQSMFSRIQEQTRQRWQNAVEIMEYQPVFRAHFKSLNLEWIERYFEAEEADIRILSNPESEILDSGGHIFFARLDGEILGTCALIKLDDKTYELAKMGVTEAARGKCIGNKLLAAAIEKAKSVGAELIYLETNSRLSPAIHLYRKHGFVCIPFDAHHPSEFQRADVRMQLDLTATQSPQVQERCLR